MRQIKVIQLNDGSTHQSKQQAERHLVNTLSSGEDLKVFEELANKNALEIKCFFISEEKRLERIMQVVRELNEVLDLK